MYEIFFVNFWVIILYLVTGLCTLKNLKNLKTFSKNLGFYQP